MRLLLASASLITMAALGAGCAQMHSSGMGAGAAPASTGSTPGTVCQDGTILPSASRCAIHGGVASKPGSAGSGAGAGH